MATKKASRAVAAAAKTSAPKDLKPADHTGLWTRAMVERAIAAFHDPEAAPAWDDDAVAARVDDYYRFVAIVARGAVEIEALALAGEMIRLGHRWLEQNPRFIRIHAEPWSQALVENTVQWFGTALNDKKDIEDTVARFAAFERVWRSGFVEAGNARAIAQAFVEVGRAWIEKTPEAKKTWERLGAAHLPPPGDC